MDIHTLHNSLLLRVVRTGEYGEYEGTATPRLHHIVMTEIRRHSFLGFWEYQLLPGEWAMRQGMWRPPESESGLWMTANTYFLKLQGIEFCQ
jgi:hypothetical protein